MRLIRTLLLYAGMFLVSTGAQSQNIEGRLLRQNEHNGTYCAQVTETRTKARTQTEQKRSGRLYFRMPDGIAIRFDDPAGDYLIYKDGHCYGMEKGKTQKYAVSEKSRTRHYFLRQTLTHALKGDVKAVARDNGGKLTSKESPTRFIFTIASKGEQGFTQIQLVYDKIEGALVLVRLTESNGNTTVYELTDGVPRQTIPEEAFAM